MLADFPPDGSAYGDAAELLESPGLGAPQLDSALDSCISGSLLKLVVKVGAYAIYTAGEVSLA